jgi:hypothetical protein
LFFLSKKFLQMDFEAKQARKLASPKASKSLLYRPNAHRVVHPQLQGRDGVVHTATVVENVDGRFRGAPNLPRDETTLAPLLYEVDEGAFDGNNLGARMMCPPLPVPPVTASFAEAEKVARQERQAGRSSLLQVFHLEAAEFGLVDSRTCLPPSSEPAGFKMMVRTRQLSFQHSGASSGHTLTVCLWSLKGEKLSEDFVCSADDHASSALFFVPMREPSIVLLVFVTRHMMDESLENVLESYAKPKKAGKSSAVPCDSRFSSPLCLAMVPLFRPDGSLIAGSADAVPLISFPKAGFDREFVTQRLAPLVDGHSLSSAFAELLKASKVLRTLPGSLMLDVSEVANNSNSNTNSNCHEMHTFNSPLYSYPNFDESVNLFFVRPLSLNLSKFTGSVKGRSLLLQVFLKVYISLVCFELLKKKK